MATTFTKTTTTIGYTTLTHVTFQNPGILLNFTFNHTTLVFTMCYRSSGDIVTPFNDLDYWDSLVAKYIDEPALAA